MEQLRNHENRQQRTERRKRSKAETPIRIKYISSPMMVQANNASEFRAIVQELTGQNSDATIPDHGTDYCEQANWVSSHRASQPADMKTQNGDELMKFSDDHVVAFGQFDEIKFWREVSESFCVSESPYGYA
ncbi:hypothetical protein ACLB2K_057479 [Fragaria x ananassa]|uniref:uncharacterized protein LOC105352572 n=1 Tax=Fragaria vesca subsp. vesca TaxID=101020 RepID=UPI0005CB1E27|nr:PREDICTED: uncharacterized protein LOC105352572 [Fragaria vesca subsp. vesca]